MAEKKIGKPGRVFSTHPIKAFDAIVLQARLMKVLGGAIDRLPTILAGAGSDVPPEAKAASDAAAIAAIADIFTKVEPTQLATLIKDVVELAAIKRPSGSVEQVELDVDFEGHQGDIIPVVVFVLREQFGDFFGDVLASGNLKKLTGSN